MENHRSLTKPKAPPKWHSAQIRASPPLPHPEICNAIQKLSHTPVYPLELCISYNLTLSKFLSASTTTTCVWTDALQADAESSRHLSPKEIHSMDLEVKASKNWPEFRLLKQTPTRLLGLWAQCWRTKCARTVPVKSSGMDEAAFL